MEVEVEVVDKEEVEDLIGTTTDAIPITARAVLAIINVRLEHV